MFLKKIVVSIMMKKKNLSLIVAVCVALSACASIRPTHSNDERIDRLNQSLGGKNVTYIIKLTSSGSLFTDAIGAIADHLIPLPNTETLTRFLRASSSPTVAVVSPTDQIGVSYIEGAIAKLKGQGSRTCIQFAGSQRSIDHLKKITARAGVPFAGVVIP